MPLLSLSVAVRFHCLMTKMRWLILFIDSSGNAGVKNHTLNNNNNNDIMTTTIRKWGGGERWTQPTIIFQQQKIKLDQWSTIDAILTWFYFWMFILFIDTSHKIMISFIFKCCDRSCGQPQSSNVIVYSVLKTTITTRAKYKRVCVLFLCTWNIRLTLPSFVLREYCIQYRHVLLTMNNN